MTRNPLPHIIVGALVILLAGVAGRISDFTLSRRAKSDREPCVLYPSTAPVGPTWQMTPTSGGPVRVLVKYRTESLPERIAKEILSGATIAQAERPGEGVGLERFASMPGLAVLGFSDMGSAEKALVAFRRDKSVAYAELDATWHVDQAGPQPNDARFREQWGLRNTGQPVNGHPGGKDGVDVDAVGAWQHGMGSSDLVVAVIDSGIDLKHEDLVENLWVNEGETPGNGIDDDGNGVVDDVHGYDAIANSGDPDDDLGHGTHVAGIIGAVGDNDRGVSGVNWTTRVMALRFLGATGGGQTSDAIACIDYILKMNERGANVRVVNCSWGSTERSAALEEAINRAIRSGVLFVCAAGNDGIDSDATPHYPSAYPNMGILSVAALSPNETIAPFSNFGELSVDIAAPGVDILSTLPDGAYGFASGTSMASPFVAGMAALVASSNPKMPLELIRARVLDGRQAVPGFDSRLMTGGRLSGGGAFAAGTSR
ncbi:MAG: S8 family serine peptidase [Blastocatellia bacterium]|nr:S8 family serine peptidase [Blastocatellia bacterium]